MANTISKNISVKASSSKPSGKPLPGGKTLGFQTAIYFYAIEDSDDTEEGEQAEIIVIYYSSLSTSKQNLVKRKFPYIFTFDHEGPTVVIVICNLTVGVIYHLEITSPMDVDKGVSYMQRILKGAALKKYKQVLVACRQLTKALAVDEWNIRNLAGLSAEAFWNLHKTDTTGYDRHAYLPRDKCVNFNRELWLELVKCMWRQ